MNEKLKVYLCDLTYDTIILVSDTIPINIGFIGSYAKKRFGEKISIELFKYPNDIIKQINKEPPDIIGFSNYSWNSNLSEYVASIAKKIILMLSQFKAALIFLIKLIYKKHF